MPLCIGPVCPCIPSFSKPITPNNTELYFQKIQNLWRDVPSEIEQFPSLCKFLYTSRLLFTILGYKRSLEKDKIKDLVFMKNPIQIQKGEPYLRFNGQLEKWSVIETKIKYDEKAREIVSIGKESEIWSYYYNPDTNEEGLYPKGRFGIVEPRYRLSGEQMKQLGITKEKPCLLQSFSSDNCLFAKLSHIGLRLISSNGLVYSLGYETLLSELPFKEQSLAGSYDAGITTLDYDEFAKFKIRRVTTTPITEEGFGRALEKIKHYNQKTLRFSRPYQNCLTYHLDVMREAFEPGFKKFPEVKISALGSVWDTVIEAPPYLDPILRKISYIVRKIFSIFGKIPLLGFPFLFVAYVGKKTDVFLSNLLLLALGGTKGSAAKITENKIDNRKGLTYFHKLLSKPSHLFDEQRSTIYSVKKFADWQLKQKSTAIYPYKGSEFYIVPPSPLLNLKNKKG